MKRPNSMSNHLLFENGWQVISNGFGSDVVDIMVRNYKVFFSFSGNISFPFYSSFLHANVWVLTLIQKSSCIANYSICYNYLSQSEPIEF